MTATPTFEMPGVEALASAAGAPRQLDVENLNPAQKFLIGLRGSYGGVLMFGLITGLAGLAVINPISVGAGLLLGTKAYREDAQQRLARRRHEAKMLVRQYVDEVTFQCGKRLRDRLRHVQRTVREYYIAVAEDLTASLDRSVEDAKRAASASASERKSRTEVVGALVAQADSTMQEALRLTLPASKPGAVATPGATPPREPVSR